MKRRIKNSVSLSDHGGLKDMLQILYSKQEVKDDQGSNNTKRESGAKSDC